MSCSFEENNPAPGNTSIISQGGPFGRDGDKRLRTSSSHRQFKCQSYGSVVGRVKLTAKLWTDNISSTWVFLHGFRARRLPDGFRERVGS